MRLAAAKWHFVNARPKPGHVVNAYRLRGASQSCERAPPWPVPRPDADGRGPRRRCRSRRCGPCAPSVSRFLLLISTTCFSRCSISSTCALGVVIPLFDFFRNAMQHEHAIDISNGVDRTEHVPAVIRYDLQDARSQSLQRLTRACRRAAPGRSRSPSRPVRLPGTSSAPAENRRARSRASEPALASRFMPYLACHGESGTRVPQPRTARSGTWRRGCQTCRWSGFAP
jgi:hypothetical protein